MTYYFWGWATAGTMIALGADSSGRLPAPLLCILTCGSVRGGSANAGQPGLRLRQMRNRAVSSTLSIGSETVGAGLGTGLGSAVRLGAVVGAGLGGGVGNAVGGAVVGAGLGCGVGTRVGSGIGVAVGAGTGRCVGDATGTAVGSVEAVGV